MKPRSAALKGADQRAAIHHARDAFQALRELDVVDRGVDRREGAEHLLGADARRERRVALRIEGLGLRHAAGHPQHDDGVGRGGGSGGAHQLRLAAGKRGQRRPAVAPMNPRRVMRDAIRFSSVFILQ